MATIGLRDVHYAKMLTDNSSGATYDTPVKISGAISANVNPNSSSATLFADDGPYDSAATLGEISLELNMADIPPAISADLLGHTYQGGMLTKRSTDTPPYVAVGYRSLKSNGAYRYTWLYKGKFTDGEMTNATKGDSIEYQTPTITGAFVKRDYDDAWQTEADSDDGNISPSTITSWFEAVVAPIVTAKTLASIAITTSPTKTAYAAGETFAIAGMVVTATYDDNTTEVVTGACTFLPAGPLQVSDDEVTIAFAYGGVTKTATQAITVKTLSSIAITTPPTKTVYTAGETFDITGMVVTATYSDSSTEVVTEACTFIPADALSTSDTEVTIAYAYGNVTKTAAQAITVTE